MKEKHVKKIHYIYGDKSKLVTEVMEVIVRPCFVQAQGQGGTAKNHALPLEIRGRL